MMISHAREYDRAIRKNILEIMQVCVKLGKMEDAKAFGLESKLLKEKIETHDYTRKDQEEMELYTRDRKWEKVMRTGSVE